MRCEMMCYELEGARADIVPKEDGIRNGRACGKDGRFVVHCTQGVGLICSL